MSIRPRIRRGAVRRPGASTWQKADRTAERTEFIQLWGIQENLLQQYRSMAIMLLGLLGAAVLVVISTFFDHWKEIGGVVYQSENRLRQLSVFMSLVLYFLLISLGWKGAAKFRQIAAERGRFVTFYQNLLLAAESGKLEGIKARHKLYGPLPSYSIVKSHLGARSKHLLRYERSDTENLRLFALDILEEGGKAGDEKVRHHMTRAFLKTFIYDVFIVFYSICFIYLAIFLIHICNPASLASP